MENRLRRWIESEEMPADFYELLGLSRFDSNPTSIEAAVHTAYRIIHPYQNHRDSQRAERARQLQMLLGDVCTTISDRVQWREYDEQLIDDLREQYARHNGRDIQTWKSESLRRWLSVVQQVHPARVDDLVRDFLTPSDDAAPKPESLRLEDDPVRRLQEVFRLSVRPPTPSKPISQERPDSQTLRRPERPETPRQTGLELPDKTARPPAPSSGLGCVAVVVIAGLILAVFAAGLGALVWVAVR